MKVAKWGNSLAVRLPKRVVEELELKEGDEIRLRRCGEAEISVEKVAQRLATLEYLKQFRGRLPAGFKFDREEANRRG